MRDFNDADRKKKSLRIRLPDNPGNLSGEALSRLADAVKEAGKEGHIACPSGWRLATTLDVSRLDVGAMIDKLGLRVIDCQLGCFKESKTVCAGAATEAFGEDVVEHVEALQKEGRLTCPAIFALARELNVRPLSVVGVANARGYKFGQCQLGCF